MLNKYASIGIGDREHIVEKSRPNWDEYFMSIANEVAKRSMDFNTNFGAVFTRENRIILTSYNSFPHGCPDNIIPNSRGFDGSGMKLNFIDHAEQAGIVYAARKGISIEGCTLTIQGHPCSSCCRALIGAGVTNWVIGNKEYRADEQEKLLRNFWVEVGKVNIRRINL